MFEPQATPVDAKTLSVLLHAFFCRLAEIVASDLVGYKLVEHRSSESALGCDR